MAETAKANPHETEGDDPSRRDFIHIAALATAGVGAVATAWPFIDQMNPSGDTLALASIEQDIAKVPAGQQLVVKWRGKPVFVRHRTRPKLQRLLKTTMQTCATRRLTPRAPRRASRSG